MVVFAKVAVLTENFPFELNFQASLSSILFIGRWMQLNLAFTNIMIVDEVANMRIPICRCPSFFESLCQGFN